MAGWRPNPNCPGGGLHLLVDLLAPLLLGLLGHAELGAQVVVVDVAGQPQAVGEGDRAVAPGGPVPLGVAAEGERPGAAVGAGRGDGAGLEAGQGGERLPGRAGRVGRLDGPVQQRLARVVRVAGEVAPGDAADEAARVVLGQAGQGEQGAVVGVEDDRGGGRGRVGAAPLAVGQPAGGPHAVGQGPLNTHLEVEVEGELEVAAGGRRAAAEGPHHLPGRVDLEVLDAVAAAQPLVVGQLDPGLADDVAGRVAAEAPLLELVGRDLADVAEHVGGGRPGRVLAQGQHLGGDPGEAVGVLGQVEELAGGDVLGDRDAAQGRARCSRRSAPPAWPGWCRAGGPGGRGPRGGGRRAPTA